MINRFEQFSSAIASIYKNIQKIEREQMAKFGLKGPHVQCLVALSRYPDGLTSAELCELCEKDKAAISRAVSELEKKGLILRQNIGERNYRAPLFLTEQGIRVAGSISELAARAVELAGMGLAEENRTVFYEALELIEANLKIISEEGIPPYESD